MKNKSEILIVDDDQDFSSELSEILKDAGFEVGEAHDGEGGIDLINQNHYNVVLLDLKLPKINGLAVLKFIKNKYPNIKVIIITGNISADNFIENIGETKIDGLCVEAALSAADYVMRKPLDAANLINKVKELAGV